ncbi:MAG: formate/nitrite transporter family protein [Roseobacter sp.]|jgi:formate/nitrite transporter FocA (FNT family)|nr:formate/nitrite transporter family protein [Roseobacter sp.]
MTADLRPKDNDRNVRDTNVEEAQALAPREIYAVICREGEEEIQRPARSLIWSGVAAGVMISLSVLGEAVLRTFLPETPESYLIENLGYSLGFLAVIIGRMQLFTENTITTVLPVMQDGGLSRLAGMLRLWGIVLGANVAGAFVVASVFVFTPAIVPSIMLSVVELSHHATGMGAETSFWRAIPAGVLVALLVWMLPQAENAKVAVIIIFTWLIAAGDFTHVVAGSVEMAVLILRGDLAPLTALGGFFLPVLAGNVIGGTAIFTLMAWGQVRDEVHAN